MTYIMTPKPRHYPPYVWYKEAFNKIELDNIQSEARDAALDAKVSVDDILVAEVRSSKIQWMSNNDIHYNWVFERLSDVIQQVNNDFYNFDIDAFYDDIQLTNYNDYDNGHYDWHIDMGARRLRKLSLVLQLSDPLDYDGGELEIATGGEPISVPKERGLISIFPSWTRHRVTPVTRGNRQTLVAWIGGPNFR